VSLRIEYHDLVDNDLLDAWAWYENQQDGLGDRFLDAVNATVLRASRWPNAGTPTIRDDCNEVIERKVATHGFPFAVRNRVLGDRFVVIAVAHQHRHPDFGTDRKP
jgi:plasmid stabilization system protein ParE